jgi:nitroreductase
MEVYEAVKTLLAVRSYEDKPIPEEIVTRIIEAGRLTASAMNRQHWDFVVVQDDQTLHQLGELASTGGYIGQAPLAIAVAVPDSTLGHIDGARAAQDMMLVAWQAGVGSNWVGKVNTPEIKELLNIPADLMVLTIIPFGYPAKEIGQGVKDRKPLSEVAHAERYGSPYRSTS